MKLNFQSVICLSAMLCAVVLAGPQEKGDRKASEDPHPEMPGAYVPSISRYLTSAKMFSASLEPNPCDPGWRVSLKRTSAFLERYHLILSEISRGECPRLAEWYRKNAKEKLFAYVQVSRQSDGTIIYRASETDRVILLADKRQSKLESQPGWVAIIDDQFGRLHGYQASVVETED